MLNKVWFCLLLVGLLYGMAKASWQTWQAPATIAPPTSVERAARPEAPQIAPTTGEDSLKAVGLTAMGKRFNQAVLDAAETSVTICIGLIGIMAVWLGLLNVAKDAGLVDAFARLLQPLMRLLFPEIPNGHPAQGAILTNLSANMLGLDNAATPLGLQAMRELQELNPVKDTATDSMVMFLAINTSSITLIPFTIMGYRALTGSTNPAAPIAGTLVATACSTIFAILVTRWMSHWPRFRVVAEDAGVATDRGLPQEPLNGDVI